MSTPGSSADRQSATVALSASAGGGARTLESLALGVAAVAFIVVAAAALIAFRLEPAPVSGPGSIGQFAAIAAAFVALPSVCAGRYLAERTRLDARIGFLGHLDIIALAVAHAAVALLAWLLLAAILAQAFLGALVFPIPVVVLAGVSAAITGYTTFSSAAQLSSRSLALLFAAFFGLGVVASMLTTSDPDWWMDNLSALGISTNVSARAFNLTLIVSGFLVTILARWATRGVPTGRGTTDADTDADTAGVQRVRVCLIALGICLALVGAFPVDAFRAIHVAVSLGLVVAFGVLVVRLSGWIPGLPGPFILLGRLFFAVTLLTGVLYAVGYYTLTAVELVGAALVFGWIILFIRNTAALRRDAEETPRTI